MMNRNQVHQLPMRALTILAAFQLSACAPAAGPASVQTPNPIQSGQASQAAGNQTPDQGSSATNQPSGATPDQAEPPPASQPPVQEAPPVAEPVPETKIESFNGIWVSAEGTKYYMRHGVDRVFIYAENASGDIPWSMAGMAVIKPNQGFDNMLTVLYSLPRGLATSSFNAYAMSLKGSKLELKLVKGNGSDVSLSLQKAMNLPLVYQPAATAVAVSQSAFKLSGRWKGNDGGTYYLRQEGNAVIWYGENDPNHPGWANMAFGSISGKTIVLNWADMPKANAVGSGLLKLTLKDDNTIERVDTEGGGFGGSKWERMIPEAAI